MKHMGIALEAVIRANFSKAQFKEIFGRDFGQNEFSIEFIHDFITKAGREMGLDVDPTNAVVDDEGVDNVEVVCCLLHCVKGREKPKGKEHEEMLAKGYVDLSSVM